MQRSNYLSAAKNRGLHCGPRQRHRGAFRWGKSGGAWHAYDLQQWGHFSCETRPFQRQWSHAVMTSTDGNGVGRGWMKRMAMDQCLMEPTWLFFFFFFFLIVGIF